MSFAARGRGLFPAAVVDLGLVGAVIALGLLSSDERGRPSIALLFVAAPLLGRRLWPLGVLLIISAVAVASSTQFNAPWAQVAAVAVASYTTGELARDRTPAALSVLLVASLMAIGFLLQDAETATAIVVPFVVLVPAWLVGDVVRSRRLDTMDRAAAEARRLREAEERLRAAATEERRHMARELHDVVAHGVSVMLIQAGAARQVLDTSPEETREALLNVEAAGREAMAELRGLLGILNDEGEATGLSPQPGLGQLDELLVRVREAGLPAELTIDGAQQPLPASLDSTVYRVVQEALTNALRYAKQARTLIHLSFEPGQLRVEILDDGPASQSDTVEGSGRGLAGLSQRAAHVGGRLEAGPRLGGGFAVRAWLPFEPEAR